MVIFINIIFNSIESYYRVYIIQGVKMKNIISITYKQL